MRKTSKPPRREQFKPNKRKDAGKQDRSAHRRANIQTTIDIGWNGNAVKRRLPLASFCAIMSSRRRGERHKLSLNQHPQDHYNCSSIPIPSLFLTSSFRSLSNFACEQRLAAGHCNSKAKEIFPSGSSLLDALVAKSMARDCQGGNSSSKKRSLLPTIPAPSPTQKMREGNLLHPPKKKSPLAKQECYTFLRFLSFSTNFS